MILHGQTHGAIAQGVGQALWEQCVVDPDSGQVMTGSFMDYAMPRADILPSFATELMEVPSPTNPLGVRAGGEGGTTPALAAVINAIVDALREFGVTHMEMPATPERVWRAIQDGKARNQCDPDDLRANGRSDYASRHYLRHEEQAVSRHEQAAADVDGLAGDVAARGQAQRADHVGHVLRHALVPDRRIGR